jgi:CheY-like chemotaxis protein
MIESISQTDAAHDVARRRILIVDDADELRELYRRALQNEGFEVRTASLAESALEIARTWRPDLVLTDLFMPGIGGLELITRLRSDFAPPVPTIVVISGFSDGMVEALKRGASRFEAKPVSLDELVRIVEDVFAAEKAPRLRSPDVIRARRNATRAIGEATLARYLTEDAGVFARIDAVAHALARFFGHSTVFAFVLRDGKLKLLGSSDPAFPRDTDAQRILPIAHDVVETCGSLVLNSGAAELLGLGHGSMAVRFLAAVPCLLDGAVIGALCLADREPHDFGGAALGILEYLSRRSGAILRDGRALDDSGLLQRDAFAAVLRGSALMAREAGHALGFSMFEVAELPRDGSLVSLLVNLPASGLMIGALDRQHAASFAVAESVDSVMAHLLLVRHEIEHRLSVVREAELVYDDPIPRLETDGFAARARDLLACAEAECAKLLAIDSVRR